MNKTDLATHILECARRTGLQIATAESCTGGMIAAALTDIPGSSDVFDRGFVTYSNAAKQQMLGVSAETLYEHGAVSAATAAEMADGACRHSNAEISVSVTGVAGPGGGSAEKPVGLVWFGLRSADGTIETVDVRFQSADRAEIRTQATEYALDLLRKSLEGR